LDHATDFGVQHSPLIVLLALSLFAHAHPLLYGTSFLERLQEHGEFEAALQLAQPNIWPKRLLTPQISIPPELRRAQKPAAANPAMWATSAFPRANSCISAGREYALSFTAPAKPGRYPFICSFPGHWRVMKGVLIVE
jgi:hypothetical protein